MTIVREPERSRAVLFTNGYPDLNWVGNLRAAKRDSFIELLGQLLQRPMKEGQESTAEKPDFAVAVHRLHAEFISTGQIGNEPLSVATMSWPGIADVSARLALVFGAPQRVIIGGAPFRRF